jgi:hypothetical protein
MQYKKSCLHLFRHVCLTALSKMSPNSRDAQTHIGAVLVERLLDLLCSNRRHLSSEIDIIFSEEIIQYSRKFAPQVQTS